MPRALIAAKNKATITKKIHNASNSMTSRIFFIFVYRRYSEPCLRSRIYLQHIRDSAFCQPKLLPVVMKRSGQ
jgi:hypothetical protein